METCILTIKEVFTSFIKYSVSYTYSEEGYGVHYFNNWFIAISGYARFGTLELFVRKKESI